jgi:glycine/D-amino acid oxidase-like deaminating enzyme
MFTHSPAWIPAVLLIDKVAFRPVTPDRVPIFDKLADSVFVCAGHGPWGIALAPGSGQVMAELLLAQVLGKKPVLSADISQLGHDRFSPDEVRDYLYGSVSDDDSG